MKVYILIHRSSDIKDLLEDVKKDLETFIQPLDVVIEEVPSLFDMYFINKPKADIYVAVLAPTNIERYAVSPVVEKLLSDGFHVFLDTYDNISSRIEDIVEYVKELINRYV